jgi:hypothetical protein
MRSFGLGSPKRYFSDYITCKKKWNIKIKSKGKYNWNIEVLVALHHLYHSIYRTMDFWVHTVLEGYAIDFSAEKHQNFSKAEAILKEGDRGILLTEIPLWIKILLVE